MKIWSDFSASGRVRTIFRALDFAGEANAANTNRSPSAVNMAGLAQKMGVSQFGLNKVLVRQGKPHIGNRSEGHQGSSAQGIYQARGPGGWLVAELQRMAIAADVISPSRRQDRRRG